MTPQDKETIRKWAKKTAAAATITMSPAQGAAGDAIARFNEQLQELLPELKTVVDTDETAFDPPALLVGRHKNIGIRAVPSGKILSSFLDALSAKPQTGKSMDTNIAARLHQIDLPILLKLYISSHCPHCPHTLDQLIALASENRHVRLSVTDAQLFPENAQDDQVKSVPTLLLDDQFRWSGQIDPGELLTMINQRDPSLLSAASLRQLIEEGQAERVAAMMLDNGKIFAALVDLLVHNRWSVRLGAMVTAEYIAADSRPLSIQLSDMLWQRFPELADSVRGDVVHVLGEIKTRDNQDRLQRIASGQYGRAAKEAADEALADM